ncbi:DNA polymerase III subunit chi [Pacificimonas sp. WHA3]|uniref:DNA polymerase III subunit chi n=1 Tax=Pacificimonas pallii TaxID=2827236 RepID=A0ABS6SG68_9SPHN|nr:DNA polymerase III subunit chi [Pacificimonas pallii]MBV7257043.1 DNA polymerase III subunit chi [Pacificimonas pallii]
MDIGFYHCTRAAPVAVLPKLAVKALRAGHRVLVHIGDPAQADAVDDVLWTFDQDSFLPHGIAGTEHDSEQPLLIADSFEGANAADLAIAMAGRLPGEEAGFRRVLFLFDGNDEDVVTAARQHWKALSDRDGVAIAYWAQGERGWEKRA